MSDEVERRCKDHPDRSDCPDCLIAFSPQSQQYGIMVHDGGSSYVEIKFCPWCGTRLPKDLE